MTEDCGNIIIFDDDSELDEGIKIEDLEVSLEDWEEDAEDSKTDAEKKSWLFKENVRIETEKKELQKLHTKFLNEKKQFQDEMKYLNKKVLEERKRLKSEELFFEKKIEILKSGFAQLEADRKVVEKERIQLEAERKAMNSRSMNYSCEDSVRLFFKGATNPLTLKKRYRDLIKIFHPDNLCGDTDLLQKINLVYEELQNEIGWQKKA